MSDFLAMLKVIHQRMQMLAARSYLRCGFVPDELARMVAGTASLDAFLKYRPDQPRAPAGRPDGGQWVREPDGQLVPVAQPTAKPANPLIDVVIDDPPLVPVYPVEYLATALASVTVLGARSAIGLVLGIGRSVNSSLKIRRAAKAIENYLGGKPDRIERNPAGDLFIMKGDKKIRFDIHEYHPHSEPHFHLEKAVPKSNGKGVDWGPIDKSRHYYPFAKEKAP